MIGTCKVCNRNDLKLFISFERYPKTISHLFSDANAAKKDFTACSFLQCNFCQHVQIANDMPQEYYEDYVMTVSHSKKMNDFQIEQAKFFVEKCNLSGKTILEVGCGDGNFLKILQDMGCASFGNEPSKPFRELALQKGLNVDQLFLNENYTHVKAPFDAVVSREVMEHVPSPVDFLKNIRRQLKPDGYVLIEVPNFEKALSELRYYDMFPDHLSYFSRESLTAAMLNSGYKNVEIFYGMEDEFIYAIAQNKILTSEHLVTVKNKIQNDLIAINNIYKHIVVWGAGGKGIAAMGSILEFDNLKYVVDSDHNKQNKFLPSSGKEVKDPQILFDDKAVDLLIITNLAYTDEILEILRKVKFSSPVKILSKNGIADISI